MTRRAPFVAMSFAFSVILVPLAGATNITLDYVRPSDSFFVGMAVDPATGLYYERPNYGPGFGSGPVNTFASTAAFKAGTPSFSVPLQNGGFFGTYFTVKGNEIFGREGLGKGVFGFPVDTSAARWNATTGAIDAALAGFAGMGGVDGPHTFNWGGFSGVNFMQDQTGLYVFGKNLGSGWQLNRVDPNLNILGTDQFNAGSLGFGFMIDGNLFAGDNFNGNSISQSLDFTTGTQSAVNFTLVGGPPSPYWNNVFYDTTTNSLFLNSGSGLYMVPDASQAFGVSSVPEPESLTLLGTGLVGLVGLLRRKARS